MGARGKTGVTQKNTMAAWIKTHPAINEEKAPPSR
jgi:hypothetical protein